MISETFRTSFIKTLGALDHLAFLGFGLHAVYKTASRLCDIIQGYDTLSGRVGGGGAVTAAAAAGDG